VPGDTSGLSASNGSSAIQSNYGSVTLHHYGHHPGLSRNQAGVRRGFWLFRALEASVWLPALVFVMWTGLLFEMLQFREWDLFAAAYRVSEGPLLLVLYTVTSTVFVAVLLQGARYTIVRWYEGSWTHSRWLAKALTIHQVKLHRRLKRQRDKLVRHALLQAVPRMLEAGVLKSIVDSILYIETGQGVPPRKQDWDQAARFDWRAFGPPQSLIGLDSINRRLHEFPKRHRIAPTKLGNILIAADEAAPHATSRSGVDAAVKERLDIAGQRIDMFCLLSLVFVVLTGLTFLQLVSDVFLDFHFGYYTPPLVICLLGIGAAVLSYEGAVANARVYRALALRPKDGRRIGPLD